MVARVSEYLFTSKSEHWLKTERAQFELPDGTLVPAQHARAHSHTHPTAVHIHIRTRKNADTRSTFTVHTTQQTNTSVTCPRCGHMLDARAPNPTAHSLQYHQKIGY